MFHMRFTADILPRGEVNDWYRIAGSNLIAKKKFRSEFFFKFIQFINKNITYQKLA